MLKTLITLVRGHTYAIAEEVADQNALLILDQQMRDATGALDTAKKALAVAIAQESQESQRLDGTRAQIEDLETRAVAAIEAGRDDLATEAAEAIATLEAEPEATLARLREHQVEADAAEEAFNALDAVTGPIAAPHKLSAEGFGPRLRPNATDVLARLRERAAGGKPEASA